MTIASHELALTIINDGKGYVLRCSIARDTQEKRALPQRLGAYAWIQVAAEGARKYESKFGTPATASCFSSIDIMFAAVEIAEYYENHLRESDAA